mmetsp:Transcript_64540/g.172963  ORF Transcript_64540/g.172963 Transcript_64540/m.172963 type:complete len:107 (+) Transcript_64540:453-773(+)
MKADVNTPTRLDPSSGAQVPSFVPADPKSSPPLPPRRRWAVRDKRHEHPLVFALGSFSYNDYGCDLKGLSTQCHSVVGKASGPRYRCRQCGYDVCPACGEMLDPVQ